MNSVLNEIQSNDSGNIVFKDVFKKKYVEICLKY